MRNQAKGVKVVTAVTAVTDHQFQEIQLFLQIEEEEEVQDSEAEAILILLKEARNQQIPTQLTKHQCLYLKIKSFPSRFTICQKLLCQTLSQIGCYLWVQNLPPQK